MKPKEYEVALKNFQTIFHAKSGTNEANEAKLLALLIEDYESKHFHIPEPDPIEAIKFMMEQSNLKQSDLAEMLGNKGNVSKVLYRKRKLSNLSASLHITADILIKDYSLSI